MTFSKKHAWLLIGVGIWNFFIWITFAKNLSAAHSRGEDHPSGYWIAHTVLIVVDLVIGAILATVGLRALRSAKKA
ncbi:hypothetical protein SAMN04487968_110114 [Nocardioides terrae]|uniref:Uncharacterized protein n=1 Tax=Nocardioides terrae TaxID=574651 RepID=A0A1I1LTW4_9ACTN|nr:hypothetical protein [Nocardioides terrae]SFC73743.1 hypothetical protein SAMN04487968_110114 [Nocardioides terrae]